MPLDRIHLVGHGLAALQALMCFLRVNERVRPGIAPIDIHVNPGLRRGGENLRQFDAFRHRTEFVIFPAMQHVHGRGMALKHLDWEDIKRFLAAEHIENHLRRVVNRFDGERRVQVAQQHEKRHGIVNVEIRASQHEEIAEHPVAVPIHR